MSLTPPVSRKWCVYHLIPEDPFRDPRVAWVVRSFATLGFQQYIRGLEQKDRTSPPHLLAGVSVHRVPVPRPSLVSLAWLWLQVWSRGARAMSLGWFGSTLWRVGFLVGTLMAATLAGVTALFLLLQRLLHRVVVFFSDNIPEGPFRERCKVGLGRPRAAKRCLRAHLLSEAHRQRRRKAYYYWQKWAAVTVALTKNWPDRDRAPDVLYCHDLGALGPGVLLKMRHPTATLIYDAHEFWPEADLAWHRWEQRFVTYYQKVLLRFVDRAYTVNAILAQHATKTFRFPFDSLPNCVPLSEMQVASAVNEINSVKVPSGSVHPLRVLFQGGFAYGRGIEEAIRAWSILKGEAHLFLRGPENPIRLRCEKLAAELGLLGRTVFFLPPVVEDQLVREASSFDVGLIPYRPIGTNHRLCCPNKLSQYMAAGLAIVTNDLVFVRSIVERHQCGRVYEDTPESLAQVIREIANDRAELLRMRSASTRTFQDTFHWEYGAAPLHSYLATLSFTGKSSGHLEEKNGLYPEFPTAV